MFGSSVFRPEPRAQQPKAPDATLTAQAGTQILCPPFAQQGVPLTYDFGVYNTNAIGLSKIIADSSGAAVFNQPFAQPGVPLDYDGKPYAYQAIRHHLFQEAHWNDGFDPANKGKDFNLGKFNTAIARNTKGSANAALGKSAISHTTGLFYFEVLLGSTIGTACRYGLCEAATSLTATAGNTIDSVAYNPATGAVTYNSGVIASLPSAAAGILLCFAFNLTSGLFWMRKTAAGLWNNDASADPTTGVNGLSIGFSGTFFAAASYASVITAEDAVYAFKTADFSGVVPTNYTFWNDTSGAAPLDPALFVRPFAQLGVPLTYDFTAFKDLLKPSKLLPDSSGGMIFAKPFAQPGVPLVYDFKPYVPPNKPLNPALAGSQTILFNRPFAVQPNKLDYDFSPYAFGSKNPKILPNSSGAVIFTGPFAKQINSLSYDFAYYAFPILSRRANISLADLIISAFGIPSTAIFGSDRFDMTIAPTGFSGTVFGVPVFGSSNLIISPLGIRPTLAFGLMSAANAQSLPSNSIIDPYIPWDSLKALLGNRFTTWLQTQIDTIKYKDEAIIFVTGDPNGVVAAKPGTIALNIMGGASTTIYVKETGLDSSGWVAK